MFNLLIPDPILFKRTFKFDFWDLNKFFATMLFFVSCLLKNVDILLSLSPSVNSLLLFYVCGKIPVSRIYAYFLLVK